MTNSKRKRSLTNMLILACDVPNSSGFDLNIIIACCLGLAVEGS